MKLTHQDLIEEYEITPYTLMVLPINFGSKVYSRIIELEDDFISPCKPIEIINKSCEYFGSSYEGSNVMKVLNENGLNKSQRPQ